MDSTGAPARPSQDQDAIVDGVYHFLDVGGQKYGECTLAIFGAIRILIDGSHVADFDGQPGYRSVPAQLEAILESPAPHEIDLMVVTHGHADHVGCLPELVAHDVIHPKWALVTDPKLGFGRAVDDDTDTHASQPDPAYRLVAALREEDASDLTDAELREFMDVAATVESRYGQLLRHLAEMGATVVPYQGQALPADLKSLLRPTGMRLLGPSQPQLLFCAEQIASTNKDAADDAERLLSNDDSLDDVALYRAAGAGQSADASRNARGNGMNCQSITLAFGREGERVLLAGDMQFTEPGVPGANDEVTRLRNAVAQAGPYRLFKTTHHTSHNGQDDSLLDELGGPPLIVHSGGLRDPSHPGPSTLQMLKRRRTSIRFARTDRNGLITVRPHLDDRQAIAVSRGRINDFTDNVRDIENAGGMVATHRPTRSASGNPLGGLQVVIVNLPPGSADLRVSGVDILVRSGAGSVGAEVLSPQPDRSTSTSRRIEAPRTATELRLAAGRALPRLLFVTNQEALERNVGVSEAHAALSAVRAAGQTLCEVKGTAAACAAAVRSRLVASQRFEGVVLLGGYDVVPSSVVDVLDEQLRRTLGSMAEQDSDDFVVWSDEAYGDVDGDRIAELAVSRVPDGRDARLLFAALQADAVPRSGSFGVRNIARPFADGVWRASATAGQLEVSERFLSTQIKADHVGSACHYFMLHGSDRDGRYFTGELEDGSDSTRAFEVGNIPRSFKGLVFTGCCWGALTVSQRANEAAGAAIAPRVVERSIALTYLKAGANAFVGCTGSHYSGPDPDLHLNFAAELHAAFWTLLPRHGYRSSPTLFAARREYSELIARRGTRQDALGLARRLKNRTQFTCLGLGW